MYARFGIITVVVLTQGLLLWLLWFERENYELMKSAADRWEVVANKWEAVATKCLAHTKATDLLLDRLPKNHPVSQEGQ